MNTIIIPEFLLNKYRNLNHVTIFNLPRENPFQGELQGKSPLGNLPDSKGDLSRGEGRIPLEFSLETKYLPSANLWKQSIFGLGDILDVRTKENDKREGLLEVIGVKMCPIAHISQEDYDNALDNIRGIRSAIAYFRGISERTSPSKKGGFISPETGDKPGARENFFENLPAKPSSPKGEKSISPKLSSPEKAVTSKTIVCIATLRKFDHDLKLFNRKGRITT